MYTIGDVYFLLGRELHYWFCCISCSLCTARTWRALSIFAFCLSILVFCLLREDRSSSSVSLRSLKTSRRLSLERPASESSCLKILKNQNLPCEFNIFVSSIQNIWSSIKCNLTECPVGDGQLRCYNPPFLFSTVHKEHRKRSRQATSSRRSILECINQ